MRREYFQLLMEGRLNEHLYEVDKECHARMEFLVEHMKARAGVTEELKAAEPMTWVGLINNLKNVAEEIILRELIYV